MGLLIAMVVPPTLDLNTPYASAPRLTGWLRALGHRVVQVDLSLELFLRIYSRAGLQRLFAAVDTDKLAHDLADVYDNRERYIRAIDSVVAFAQGRDMTPVHRIARRELIPEGPRFRRERAERRHAPYGEWGINDLARDLTARMFSDLTDLFRHTISKHYGLTTYGDQLAESCASFDDLEAELTRPANEIEKMLFEAASDTIPADVDLLCVTCPFPGNVLGSLLLGKWAAEQRPKAKRALGGGYPSTELRQISDPRVFRYIDYLVLDDGEVPLQQITARLAGQDVPLERTFTCESNRVVYHNSAACAAPRFRDLPAPDYAGLDLQRYAHVIYRLNRVSRLLSEGSWLKLTAAHGCYWKKCTFCDIHLSYIADFDPLSATGLADQMDSLHQQTGRSGFHFTDEAAPPPLMVKLATELLRRDRSYQWWGNVRFDPGFTPDRCRVLAAGGMIAVTGGIEIASDELLPKIAKGITVKQVIHVLSAFTLAGIMTHAYLIHGFPGETEQDTINSLEVLRQMMQAKLLQSAFYHGFSLTAHSPIAKAPQLYGLRPLGPQFAGFAHYVIQHRSVEQGRQSNSIREALQAALSAYARGEGFDRPVESWVASFGFPKPTVVPDFVASVLAESPPAPKSPLQLVWLGSKPTWSRGLLHFSDQQGEFHSLQAPKWMCEALAQCHPSAWKRGQPPLASDFQQSDWQSRFARFGLAAI
ncbi:MAG TPA: radical SAM protein [Pseudomonadota bacterium]|nr:radical SAM protein [Pseudomonadota bacterium]